jgi:hypothetical protein
MKPKTMGFYLIFLVLFLFIFVFEAYADNTHDIVAQNFLKYLNCDKEILSARMIEANTLNPTLAKMPVAYLVNLKDSGFILISTSDEFTPIKAYSLHGDFDTMPAPFKEFLLLEMEYNCRQAVMSGTIAKKGSISDTQRRWNFLLNYDQARTASVYNPNTYLLTTTWNQDYPYNKYLPEIDGKNVVAGCVNVAMSQLMKYYGYPAAGTGVYSYEWNAQQLKTIIYRPFNWDNMPDSLTGDLHDCQVDEVARLINNLGVMNETDFSLDNSGASSNCTGFIRSFGYARDIMQMRTADTNQETFFDTLRAEIDAMRPVLLSFPGHMTVADGYASDETGRKIHINMGWGGHDNDYYYLDATVQAGNFIFQPNLEMLYNIKPCNGEDCTENLEATDSIAGLDIAGKFDFSYDVDEYYVYLNGDTEISGNRNGYSGQPFYISIYDTHNIKLVSKNETIEINLEPGKYRIRISLIAENGSFYPLDDKDAYTVTTITEAVSPAEKTLIDESLDIAPVIYNEFETIMLNTGNQTPYCMLIDACDENGDALVISIDSTNINAVTVDLDGNVLSITPAGDAGGQATKITVIATANAKTIEKSFVVMVSDQDVAFGRNFDLNGIFEFQADYNTHKVVLDGACSISGYNGYTNQAFFTSVLDVDENTIIAADDQTIDHNFVRDFYFIGASLKQNPAGGGSLFNYETTNHEYMMTVNCPDADDNIENLAALFGIDLSGTQKPTDLVIDLNDDQVMDMVDTILLLQVLSGAQPGALVLSEDLNHDGQVDLTDVLFMLQIITGIR